jgi:hypothetical protein
MNTNVIQNFPDYCYEELKDNKIVKKGLNPRYPFFRQNYYTAGDADQFLENWKVLPRTKVVKGNNCQSIPISSKVNWKKYHNICNHTYYDTFNYVSDKFKKGCLIQIHDNELKTYLPFSKQNYQNEWGRNLEIDPKFGTIYEMMKYLSDYDNTFPYNPRKIHKDMSGWYGNNGLVRFEFPLSENDTGYNMLKDMFECLVKERDVVDIDFFLNKRDFPILKGDGTEPYEAFFGNSRRLVSHTYSKYAPILSMNTSINHVDIPIPTWDDWSRVAYQTEKKLFKKNYTRYPSIEELSETKWEDKIPTLIFRGASTGTGTTIDNNPRLFFSNYSKTEKYDSNGDLIMDVGLTKMNLRPRKNIKSKYLTTIYMDEIDIPLKEFKTPLEQSKYKYILHLPGHTCAYRLSLEMYYGSVIFIFKCPYKLWFFDSLIPWEHYIPVSDEISEKDLLNKLEWCKQNDEKCKMIAENARKFAIKYLGREGILNYLEKTFYNIHLHNLNFNYKTVANENNCLEKYLNDYKENLFQKPTYFLNDIFEDILENGNSLQLIDCLKDNYIFLQYFFNYLDSNKLLNDFLGRFLVKEDFINYKKSDINLYNFYGKYWIEKKIVSNWKNDDLHQVYIGINHINHLATRIPNFVHTYFYYHNLNKDNTRESINIFIDYKNTKTLDFWIREKKLSFDELLQIWISIIGALEEAQQNCSFIHMDLYPWNILIEEKENTVTYLDYVKIKSKHLPILIDYGNSHVIQDGKNIYTTTPFIFNRFQDVISLVLSTLDIFLSICTLNDNEIKNCIKIMNFFSNSDFSKNEKFFSISHIKRFIKKNKKFSVMLSSPKKDFENYRPFDFLDFLFKENLVDNMSYTQQVEKYDYIIHNNPLSHYFYLLNIIQSINNNSNHNVHNSDCIIWLKRIWNEFFRDINTNYDLDFYNKSLRILLYKFENYFIETETKILQNNNLSIIDKTIQKNEFIEKLIIDKDIITSWINEITISKNKKIQNLPLLKTHPCILCDVVEQKQKTDYFTIEFLYSLKSIINNEKLNNIDFFYEKTHCLII